MKVIEPYRLMAGIRRRQPGDDVEEVALAPDWGPAVAWAHFAAIRAQRVAPTVQPGSAATVAPRFAPQPPGVNSLAVSFTGVADVAVDIPVEYLRPSLQVAIGRLAAAGRLAEGEVVDCRFRAYPTAHGLPGAESGTLVEEVAQPLPIDETPLDGLLSAAPQQAAEAANPLDVPLLVVERVMSETRQLAKAAGEFETGGILLGRLHRGAAGDLALIVTAQIPARYAEASATSLRFTPQTWAAADAAMRLRRGREIALGWWHAHPRAVWVCKGCPPEKRARCKAGAYGFFSADDLDVQRVAFPAAWNVALLLSFQDDADPRFDAFGWRAGAMARRDFHVVTAVGGEPRPQRSI